MASPISKTAKGSGTWRFENARALQSWGARLARILRPGDVVALTGPLGAGKTTLVQAAVSALGSSRGATSPTFALVHEYATRRGAVYHMDMYRLSPRELAAFPLEEYGDGICLIEWADRIRARWPQDALDIRLTIQDAHTRNLEIQHPSKTWMQRLRSAFWR